MKTTEPLPPELKDLEQLAGQADAELAGAEISATGAPGQAELEVSQADQIKGLLHLVVMTLSPALPFLPECYPESTREQIATCAAAVCDKHGWNVGDVMTPELALAAVTIPPTIAAYVSGRAYFAQRAAAEASSSSSSSSSRPEPATPLPPIDTRPQAGERVLQTA